MNNKFKLVILIAVGIIAIDQLTKWLVVAQIPFGTENIIFPSWFSLVHFRNRGAAFGFLSNWDSAYRDMFFYVLAFIALGFLTSLVKQVPDNKIYQAIPISLILGGAIGNILDRIFRGSVVDFLLVHINNQHVSWNLGSFNLDFDLVWPAFNVADSGISVGVVWLMFSMLKPEFRAKQPL